MKKKLLTVLLGVGMSLGASSTVVAYDDCYGDYLRCLQNSHPSYICVAVREQCEAGPEAA